MPPRQPFHWVAHNQEDPQFPEFLFHIQHADSQATYSDSEISIKAADTAFGPSSVSDASELLGHAIRRQDWTDRRPSRFISTFEDAEQARQWGYLRNGPVYMYIINTRLLPQSAGKWVFWLSNSPCEYLILDQIPRNAIVASEKIRPRFVTTSQMASLAEKSERLRPWAVSRHNLPPRLYFVQHAGSQSTRDRIDVLDVYGNAVAFIDAIESAVQDIEINSLPELYAMIKNHVNWYQRRPSMFVSTFSVRKHAENWGRRCAGPVWMYEFDTSKLPASQLVFRARDFIDKYTDNEYLFLLQIPCCGLRDITLLVDGEPPREPLVHCFTPSPAW
ncbi:hypothetical protein GE21DRAFT_9521 [Neurospora crassa]|uniref:DUF7587 domain-containing protein n=1 Tax=Neurospora crassa (strain ATCC 24698 / 74-OR23-1A / CBS 708.71 / DSM 1257 / FGSC 987) TaxID=367110 RepID=Q7RWK1_NEUCR|nr:hypothetical protein NCU05083 [Neurospora crassa OR74A]EAA26836.2 hypothetical protein NCU05083 [Neurospora crassa OR74A]KHE83874.1 hypothetical protein GE21DRAFT_9521 [Neurospora crassa]|eukprot:XP_956072.2 hypothetical protein NCU05083 [Neurospora crassa OR74A]